jgi:IS4 transposase
MLLMFLHSLFQCDELTVVSPRLIAATTSKNFVLRFFYFAFACLLYSIWRAVDLLVQIEVTSEYMRSQLVTANTVLTLLKQTGIG